MLTVLNNLFFNFRFVTVTSLLSTMALSRALLRDRKEKRETEREKLYLN